MIYILMALLGQISFNSSLSNKQQAFACSHLQYFTCKFIFKQESSHGTDYMRLNKHIKMFNVE